MTSLDEPASMAKVDRSGMLATAGGLLDDFLAAFRAARTNRYEAPANLGHLVVSGMGGSGISGTLAQSLLAATSRLPVTVVKDYHLPTFVGPATLLVAVSYSGDTEETLSCVAEAQSRRTSVVAICSGGKLAGLPRGPRFKLLKVPSGRQPRAALGHLLGSLLGLAASLQLAPLEPDARLEREVREAKDRVRPESPEATNPAKQFARDLHRAFPYWYGSGVLAPVALRGRCQLNENAKMLARNEELPEGNHNELVPWSQVEDPQRYFVGLLRQADEPPKVRSRFDFLHSVLKRRKVPHREYVVHATTPLGKVLQGILFVDHVSLYAAILRGVDPAPIEVIGELKARLAAVDSTPAVRPGRRG